MVDNVCMCIQTEFVAKLLTDIETQCFLFAVSLQPSDLSQLLKENPELHRKIQRLTDRQSKLQTALSIFNDRAPDIPSSHVLRRYRDDDSDDLLVDDVTDTLAGP